MRTFIKKISHHKKKIGLSSLFLGAGFIGMKHASIASILTAFAKFISDSSVVASIFFTFEEPKMPTSMILQQNDIH